MRKIKNMKISGLLALAMAFVLLVGSLAYFTDRVTKNATFNTATVSITPDPETPPADPEHPENKLTAKWLAVNATALANFNPGDKLDLSYKLANTGELAVDVRETFVITSSKPLSATPEFRLFSTVSTDTAGANVGGDVVVTEEKIDSTHYKYTVAAYTLNGSDETVSGTTVTAVDKAYFLVFDKTASNAFQGAKCTVDYVVEAKQHSTGTDDWATAATGSVTLGNQTIDAVPAA